MKVHHLDCCSMCPFAGSLVNAKGRMVAHCLLIETDRHGLVLVDTGIGTDDVLHPAERLGGPFVRVAGPQFGRFQTALEHVQRLGFQRSDVRHILLTHLDLDHAGGLPDFPEATVHVHLREQKAAMERLALPEQHRYRPCHFSHGPKWKTYEHTDGEPWFGFAAVRSLEGLPVEFLAVPLHGHSRGHWALAINDGTCWLFHAGDAYFHRGVVDRTAPSPRPGAMIFERLVAMNYDQVRVNHQRLRALHEEHGSVVSVFSAHDPEEFSRFS